MLPCLGMSTKPSSQAVDSLRKPLGVVVRRLMGEAGLSLRALADVVDCEHAVLHRLEHGRHAVPLDLLAKVAAALGETPAGLVRAAQSEARRQAEETQQGDPR